ncbi:MAG TPA: hypothetical protein VG602_05645, partial [Actinomycetota bacterium]|nr:hypothetical protein [Actinomycetota bacterium]
MGRLTLGAALTVGMATLVPATGSAQVAPDYDPAPGGQAVVALVDTGINPYHATFRDGSERSFEHPSTYIPGYPPDAIALPITLTEPNWTVAVRKDCELWKTVQPGQLY